MSQRPFCGRTTPCWSDASQAVPLLEERLSLGVSVVLIAVYLANLIYTLVTHRNVFAMEREERPASE